MGRTRAAERGRDRAVAAAVDVGRVDGRGNDRRSPASCRGGRVAQSRLGAAGIATLEATNCFIAEQYLPEHNAAFVIAPAETGSAFVPDRGGQAGEILCIREERRVGNDNTVRWRGLTLQIPPSPLRPQFVRATVRIHEYPDGRLALFHGPHRLAEYDGEGNLRDDGKLTA